MTSPSPRGQEFIFEPHSSRKAPDPVDPRVENHYLTINVKDLPSGLPLDANAREFQKISKRVHKEVEASLLKLDGSVVPFHQKHGGITVVAEHVYKRGDRVVAVIAPGQGIVNGGNTYKIIETNRDNPDLTDDQYVSIKITSGVPTEALPEIAGGLNTSLQVQPMSLDNLRGDFELIKGVLKSEPYYDTIAWKEGDAGDYDARDIVSILSLFNIYQFPNSSQGEFQHPIQAYEKKSAALQWFEEDVRNGTGHYEQLLPLLTDILVLHDTIRMESRGPWNKGGGQESEASRGRFGALAIVQGRKQGSYDFPFIQKTAKYRLHTGALYPMLAAFRWMVEHDVASGAARWRGGFAEVMKRWDETAYELMQQTYITSKDLGYNPNAVGKNRAHWANLFRLVQVKDMEAIMKSAGIGV